MFPGVIQTLSSLLSKEKHCAVVFFSFFPLFLLLLITYVHSFSSVNVEHFIVLSQRIIMIFCTLVGLFISGEHLHLRYFLLFQGAFDV